VSEQPRLIPTDLPEFDAFWAAYPRHDGKKDARAMWIKIKPGPELVKKILAALEWQRPEMLRSEKCFRPLPETWLRGERWEDEPFHAPPALTVKPVAPTRFTTARPEWTALRCSRCKLAAVDRAGNYCSACRMAEGLTS